MNITVQQRQQASKAATTAATTLLQNIPTSDGPEVVAAREVVGKVKAELAAAVEAEGAARRAAAAANATLQESIGTGRAMPSAWRSVEATKVAVDSAAFKRATLNESLIAVEAALGQTTLDSLVGVLPAVARAKRAAEARLLTAYLDCEAARQTLGIVAARASALASAADKSAAQVERRARLRGAA